MSDYDHPPSIHSSVTIPDEHFGKIEHNAVLGNSTKEVVTEPSASSSSTSVKSPGHGNLDPGPVDQAQIVTMPFKQLIVVFIALMLGVFLAALDQTIVSVCTTKIANDFHALADVPWVGTAYLLTSTSFQPLYGRFSDIFGRKTTFLFGLIIFMIGSALCGAAQSMTMMIVARAIAGVGAGGIMSMVMIIITGIVSLRDRGKYQGLIGACFGLSSVIGPLLGGVFTDKATWRWAFFINLPIGAITVAATLKLLHLPHTMGSFREKMKRVDFLGSLTLICGLILILLPLNWGGSKYEWNSGIIIGLFCAGFAVLIVFCLIEWKVAAEPIIPFHLFKNRSNSAVFATSLFLGMGFFGVMFFVPLYFQIVRQETATRAGLEMLPLVVGLLISTIGSGAMVSKWGKYRPFIWVGFVVAATGAGLLTLLSEHSSRGAELGYLFVQGVGIGLSLQTTVLAIQSSVEPKDIAVATANATFFRTVGSALGVAIIGTVFNNAVKSNLEPLIMMNPDVARVIADSYLAPSFGPEMEAQILHAYMEALRSGFRVVIPFFGLGWLCSLFIRHYKMRKDAPPVME
ncbi:hypothetical protein EDD11_009598 [Mortierella claussenii]|nr:hypothetical protein EDD11_009598 [Mortierella claussenii]